MRFSLKILFDFYITLNEELKSVITDYNNKINECDLEIESEKTKLVSIIPYEKNNFKQQFCYMCVGIFYYLNPIYITLVIKKEISRLEIILKKEKDKKYNKDYYDLY